MPVDPVDLVRDAIFEAAGRMLSRAELRAGMIALCKHLEELADEPAYYSQVDPVGAACVELRRELEIAGQVDQGRRP